MPQTAPLTDPLAGHPKYRLASTTPLGAGTFGQVLLYRDVATGEKVAIKFMRRDSQYQDLKYVEFELLNHRILRHPHVIEFKEVFLTEQAICIVLEYANGGTLFKFVQKEGSLREHTARWFFQHLIIGLDYCHRKGIVNRDIKLENMLLKTIPEIPLPLVKICDFGYSKADYESQPDSKVGTLAYMAPEVIKAAKYDGEAADIWSCGIMLYVMLFGFYPFDPPGGNARGGKRPPQEVMQRILSMKYCLPADKPISTECRDLLEHLIRENPAERLTMAQIQKHPWFVKNLPQEARVMNDECIAKGDESGVQSREEIMAILNTARHADAASDLDTRIDEEIEAELVARAKQQQKQQAQSQQQAQQQQQQQQQQQTLVQQQQQRAASGGGAAAPAAAAVVGTSPSDGRQTPARASMAGDEGGLGGGSSGGGGGGGGGDDDSGGKRKKKLKWWEKWFNSSRHFD